MKIKTSEATKLQIDWLVATVENVEVELDDGALVFGTRYESDLDDDFFGCEFDKLYIPSTDWAQGGPIIEREKIDIEHDTIEVGVIGRMYLETGMMERYGPTPLVAAMRCFITSKLGDEVEVPEGLL